MLGPLGCAFAVASTTAWSAVLRTPASTWVPAETATPVELVTAALREGVTGDRGGVTKSRDAVKQILGRMAKSGDLRRLEKGRYELPTNPESLSH